MDFFVCRTGFCSYFFSSYFGDGFTSSMKMRKNGIKSICVIHFIWAFSLLKIFPMTYSVSSFVRCTNHVHVQKKKKRRISIWKGKKNKFESIVFEMDESLCLAMARHEMDFYKGAASFATKPTVYDSIRVYICLQCSSSYRRFPKISFDFIC